MEKIERYIYAVTKRLPESQRQDVADELHSLIQDMLEENTQGGAVTDEAVNQVLLQLGHPRTLAQEYRGGKKYLIGPELYDLYMFVLKIALISVVALFTAVFVFQVILNPVHILDYFIDYIVSFFTTSIPVVIGWTTFGFALVEYFSQGQLEKVDLNKGWHPSNLPAIPDSNKQIKRSESVVSIVFYVLIIVFLSFSSEYFGVWTFHEGELSGVVPFINEASYSSFLLLALIILAFGIVKECLKYIYERWTKSLLTYTTVLNLISIAFVLFVMTTMEIWNPNFMQELVQQGIVNEGSNGYETVRLIWEQFTFWIFVLLLIGLVWEIISGVIKTFQGKK